VAEEPLSRRVSWSAPQSTMVRVLARGLLAWSARA
jgi:hypothetical protein